MKTTPAPKWGAQDTNRKIINTSKKISTWIKENAIRDAELRGHRHLVFIWENEKEPLRESVQNDMADYLFHWDQSEIPRDSTMDFLKPFNPPNTSMDREPPFPVRAAGGLLQDDKP